MVRIRWEIFVFIIGSDWSPLQGIGETASGRVQPGDSGANSRKMQAKGAKLTWDFLQHWEWPSAVEERPSAGQNGDYSNLEFGGRWVRKLAE